MIPATGETIALHAYWDRLLGGYSSPKGAIADAEERDGVANMSANQTAAQTSDPETWVEESAGLAKQYAYASPVSLGANAVMLTRDYETNASSIARSQAVLAGARLANLLNQALK